MELLAALVVTRLLHYFCTATNYNINQAILRSDATVALGWICSDPNNGRLCLQQIHGDKNTLESRPVEAYSGIEQPCGPSLNGTSWQTNTVLGYLVVRTGMACTVCGRLAICSSPDESPTPRREKETKPSPGSNHVYHSY